MKNYWQKSQTTKKNWEKISAEDAAIVCLAQKGLK